MAFQFRWTWGHASTDRDSLLSFVSYLRYCPQNGGTRQREHEMSLVSDEIFVDTGAKTSVYDRVYPMLETDFELWNPN